MNSTIVLPRETLLHVAARTISTTSYTSLALYIQDIVAANPLVVDWSAITTGLLLVLPG